jgi:oligoribonuclease (3'-5' exoribonuclease)
MRLILAGVDGEMSGPDPTAHSLIQIGVALSEHQVFSSRIGWDAAQFDPEALKAIGWTSDELRDGPSAQDVDQRLVSWLREHAVTERSIVAVGWGVSVFDIPFIRKCLPSFACFLHHHTVELNAIMYAFGDSMSYLEQRPNAAGWKRMAKYIGEHYMYLAYDRHAQPHDAGDDAVQAIKSLRWIKALLEDVQPEIGFQGRRKPGHGDRLLTVDATRSEWPET